MIPGSKDRISKPERSERLETGINVVIIRIAAACSTGIAWIAGVWFARIAIVGRRGINHIFHRINRGRNGGYTLNIAVCL